jgi:hypothetical protein
MPYWAKRAASGKAQRRRQLISPNHPSFRNGFGVVDEYDKVNV